MWHSFVSDRLSNAGDVAMAGENFVRTLVLRASILQRRGDLDAALDAARRALAVPCGGGGEARALLAQAHFILANGTLFELEGLGGGGGGGGFGGGSGSGGGGHASGGAESHRRGRGLASVERRAAELREAEAHIEQAITLSKAANEDVQLPSWVYIVTRGCINLAWDCLGAKHSGGVGPVGSDGVRSGGFSASVSRQKNINNNNTNNNNNSNSSSSSSSSSSDPKEHLWAARRDFELAKFFARQGAPPLVDPTRLATLIWANHAATESRLGRDGTAEALARQAVALAPNVPELYEERARIFARRAGNLAACMADHSVAAFLRGLPPARSRAKEAKALRDAAAATAAKRRGADEEEDGGGAVRFGVAPPPSGAGSPSRPKSPGKPKKGRSRMSSKRRK